VAGFVVKLSDRGGADGGYVTLSEPTDINPPLTLMGNCCDEFAPKRQWPTSNNTAGTRDPGSANRLILEATPGVHTYRLEYKAYSSDHPAAFRNRKLWVEPLG
jgi:hypothetical protein